MGTACSKGKKTKSKNPVKGVSIKRRVDDDDSSLQANTNQSATDGHLRHDNVIDIEVSHGNVRSELLHSGGNEVDKPSSDGDDVKINRCAASDDDDSDDENNSDDNDDNHCSSSSESEDDVDSPPVSGDEQEQEEESQPQPIVETGNVEAYTLSDERVELACKGRFDFDMPQNIKIVRIFTSSTFTDTSVERNTLMVKVYPRIKKFCQERGYEFQIVDMRWGVRDESTDDHLTSELCMKELDACQKLSTGPNFITFLGQKYGYRPFPPKIPSKEFQKLFKAVANNEDRDLLQRWFKEDKNSVPSQYLLQPITHVLPDYRNYEQPELRKQASSMWWTAFERMQVIFRNAAAKVLNKKEQLKYFMSVTEDEVRRGIIMASSPEDHCFWFKRVITDLDKSVQSPKAGSFIDKDWGSGEVDQEAKSFLETLREKDLPGVLPSTNIKRYEVAWSSNGIDPDGSPQHAKYIDDLCKTFYDTLTSMIDKAIGRRREVEIKDNLIEEVTGHLSFCLKKCQTFHGRGEFLEEMRKLVTDRHRTVVIYGESGCGKTSIMAKACTLVRNWIGNDECIVVTRFIGTSPDSSSIRPLLRSICTQLCRISGEDPNAVPQDMKALVEYLPECLENAASSSHPVVLILDSLDQLSADEGGRQMGWLPKWLPDDVYLILSTLPGDEYECLPRIKALTSIPNYCIKKVPPIPLSEADIILKNWLQAASRSLTPPQSKLVIDAFDQCQIPLYLKLAFDEACRWKSYSEANETVLAPTVKGIINALFDRVERIHGKRLVGHALGYITASKNGLTEVELEDLLSLDDDVLNDVYQYWTPPLRRLPPLLWIRIRSDINDYLIDRGADGTRVIYWYHRQFIEVARERYLSGDQATKIHANMTEYFLGTWSQGKKKPYVNKKGESLQDDRLVSEMPIVFGKSDDNPIYNLRKLSELPYHLYHSKQYDEMKEEALCNFEFLLAKLQGTSVNNVLDDFKLYMSTLPSDPDVKMMQECLRLSQHSLSIDPKQFPTQLLGRMFKFQDRKEKFPYLCQILEQAKNASTPCFIPNHKFLTAPGGALVSTITLGNYGQECISIGNDNQTMASTTVTGDGLEIKIINFQSGEQLRKFTVTSPSSMYRVTKNIISEKNLNHLLLAGGNEIYLLNTQTGQIIKTFPVDDDDWFSHHQKPPVSYADDEKLLVALTRNSLRVWQTSDCKVLKDIPVKDINVDEEFGHLAARGKYVVYNLNGTKDIHFVDIKQGREVDKVTLKYKKSDYGTNFIQDLKVTSKDQVVVVPASQSDHLRVYDLVTANLVREITTFKMTQGIGSIQITDDGTKALSIDMFEIRATDLETGESENCLRSAVFRTKLITRDGNTILAIGQDFVLRVFDRSREDDDENKEDTTVSEYEGNKIAAQITMIQPSFDKRHIASISYMQMKNSLAVWDNTTGQKVRHFKEMQIYPSMIRINQDSTFLAVLIHDEKLPFYKVINLKEGTIETLEGGACKRMNAFGFIDNQRMISFSRNRKNLKIWDITTRKVVELIKLNNKEKLEELIISPNGKEVVCSISHISKTYPEGTTLPLYTYNTVTKKTGVLTIKEAALSLHNAKLSDDGRYLVTLVGWNYPHLWDLESGEMMCKLVDPTPDSYQTASNSAINTDANTIVTCVGTGGVEVWNLKEQKILRRIPGNTLTDIFLSTNGDFVIARDQTANTIFCWNVHTKQKITSITTDGMANFLNMSGDSLVMGVGENPNLMIMKLQVPGNDISKDKLPPSPFDGLPVDAELKDNSKPPTEKDSLDKDKVEEGNFT